jgi:hypothetical protein
MMADAIRLRCAWRGLDLHYGRSKRPVLSLVADEVFPHLFRIVYPDGWTSTPANLTRARDAACGHARSLLFSQASKSGVEAVHSPESDPHDAGEARA